MNDSDGIRAEDENNEINLTPMLDVVFIMLIFFVVTAVFVQVPGVEIWRPEAQTAEPVDSTSVLVAISASNEIWLDGSEIDLHAVRTNIERMHAQSPGGGLVIQADSAASNRYVLAVMDAAQAAGIVPIVLAAAPMK